MIKFSLSQVRQSSRLLRLSLGTVLVGVSLAGFGCGGAADSGPPRFRVSGKVTFDGQPVPFGAVNFDPDSGKKNSGPQGTALIRNGQFDTNAPGGKGTVGGPMIVTIYGKTHEVVSEGGEGRILFDHFTEARDLPREKTTLDFDVPPKSTGKARK